MWSLLLNFQNLAVNMGCLTSLTGVFIFFWFIPRKGVTWIIWRFSSVLLRTLNTPSRMLSFLSTSSLAFILFLLDISPFHKCEDPSHYVLIYVSILVRNDLLVMCLLTICVSSSEKFYSSPLSIFQSSYLGRSNFMSFVIF